MEKQIAEVEKKINALIKEDASLKHLFDLVTSVDGVGGVVFCKVVIATNEFKLFSCPKKFACYSGVAPFEHTPVLVSEFGLKTFATVHRESLH